MSRIFSVLAVLAVLLLAANFVVGLAAGDFNAAALHKREAQQRLVEAEQQAALRGATTTTINDARQAAAAADADFRGPRARMTLHMLLGAAAALMTVLVNSITVTYFIGTSRWCQEVCDAYQLDAKFAQRSTRLKRSAFPWALAGIAAMIAVVGLGAAADPSGANWRRSAEFVMPHYAASMLGIVIVAVAFWIQANRVAENYELIKKILGAVEQVRAAKGLPIEEPSAT